LHPQDRIRSTGPLQVLWLDFEVVFSSGPICAPYALARFLISPHESLIHVDIGGHPPFPTGSKQISGNFGNLLFLAVFHFRSHFETLNNVFWENGVKYEITFDLFP
jgi:hypothetical protein